MTERGARHVTRTEDNLHIGPSHLEWNQTGLTVHINEVGVPLPRRIRGTVRLYPQAVETQSFALDAAGRHLWRPIAPCARVEVKLEQPGISWSGPAYFDSNRGERPLEQDFTHWDWCRAQIPGATVVLYNVAGQPHSANRHLALRFDDKGGATEIAQPPVFDLPVTRWRVARQIGGAGNRQPRVIKTLEDAPFYARSMIATQLLGADVVAIHESLSLDRFRRLWVQAMLPFRMPYAF